MDPERFDTLVRSLNQPATRRGVLGSALAGLLGARAAPTDAKGGTGKQGKKGKRGTGAGHPPSGAASDGERHYPLSCVRFCATTFRRDPRKKLRCLAEAAFRRGLCYACGPAAPPDSGKVLCGQACVTLGTDQNCARCGDACGAGTTCQDGQCRSACIPDCEGKCGGAGDGCGGTCDVCCPSGTACPPDARGCCFGRCENGRCCRSLLGGSCDTVADCCQSGSGCANGSCCLASGSNCGALCSRCCNGSSGGVCN